jgi:hypothetical protein
MVKPECIRKENFMHPSNQQGYTPPQASQYTTHTCDGTASQAGVAQTPHYAQNTAAYPQAAPTPTGVASWFDFSNSGYLKGFLAGAGATLLLTNPTIQKALVRGTVKAWSFVQGGVEEVKEQFRDVNAEMSQE